MFTNAWLKWVYLQIHNCYLIKTKSETIQSESDDCVVQVKLEKVHLPTWRTKRTTDVCQFLWRRTEKHINRRDFDWPEKIPTSCSRNFPRKQAPRNFILFPTTYWHRFRTNYREYWFKTKFREFSDKNHMFSEIDQKPVVKQLASSLVSHCIHTCNSLVLFQILEVKHLNIHGQIDNDVIHI